MSYAYADPMPADRRGTCTACGLVHPADGRHDPDTALTLVAGHDCADHIGEDPNRRIHPRQRHLFCRVCLTCSDCGARVSSPMRLRQHRARLHKAVTA